MEDFNTVMSDSFGVKPEPKPVKPSTNLPSFLTEPRASSAQMQDFDLDIEVPDFLGQPEINYEVEKSVTPQGVSKEEKAIARDLERKGMPQSFLGKMFEPIRETAQDIGQGVKSFGQSSYDRVKRAEKAFDEQGMMAGVGEFATQLTGGVQDVVGDTFMTALKVVSPEDLEKGASAVIGKLGEKAMTIKDPMTGQTLGEALPVAMEKYDEWAKENPAKDRAVRASGNILMTALDLVGFKGAGTVTKNTLKETGKELLETGAEQLVKSGDNIAEHLAKRKEIKQLAKDNKVVQGRIKDLDKISSKYISLDKFVNKQAERGINVKENLASTDLLKGAVDKDGVVRTTGQDGAVSKYNDFLKPQEDIVERLLKNDGETIDLDVLEKMMIDNLNKSKIKGSTKASALKRIKSEIEGLALDAQNGKVGLDVIQQAKVQKYSSINYLDPEKAQADKLVARSLKEGVETSSNKSIKDINKDLAEHYATREFLEKLDKKRVAGGRLGKYFAQTTGAIAGSYFGPLGSIVGAEAGGLVKGVSMGSTFGKTAGKSLEVSPLIKNALSTLDNQSNKLGSLKTTQSTNMTPTKKFIKPTISDDAVKVKKKAEAKVKANKK